MENNKSLKKDYKEKQLLVDAYNDDYWQKKYGVSSEEIKKTDDIGIQDKIISINRDNKLFTAEV